MFRREDCVLRPLGEPDLERVLSWRNSERIRKVMLSYSPISLEDHFAWFKKIQSDPHMIYRIFEFQRRARGLVSFPGITDDRTCHWGFYLADKDGPRGLGKAMTCLALELAFGALGLETIYAETFKRNESGIALHIFLGFQEQRGTKLHPRADGRAEELIAFALSRAHWESLFPELRQSLFGKEGAIS